MMLCTHVTLWPNLSPRHYVTSLLQSSAFLIFFYFLAYKKTSQVENVHRWISKINFRTYCSLMILHRLYGFNHNHLKETGLLEHKIWSSLLRILDLDRSWNRCTNIFFIKLMTKMIKWKKLK